MKLEVSSGAEVTISSGSWGETTALRRALNKNVSEGLTSDANTLQVALKVESSKEVYDAVFSCLGRCTYNGSKITEATFEDENARQDYLDIVCACINKNMEPFKKKHPSQLLAFLGDLNQPQKENQKSELTMKEDS